MAAMALPRALSPKEAEAEQGARLLDVGSPPRLLPEEARRQQRPVPDSSAAQVQTLPPFLEALAAAHRALQLGGGVPLDEKELRKAEVLLSSLIAEVRSRLEGGGQEETPTGATSGEPGGEETENGFLPTPKMHNSSPDALDDWYTDPWAASSASAEASSPSAPVPERRDSSSRIRKGGSGLSPSLLRNPLEIFLDNEDAATEVEGNPGDALGRSTSCWKTLAAMHSGSTVDV
jgi:hypothetical protein